MARIVVYSGKGGVGKTSIAAATALLCAERGLRTLVISTDIAHSLADSFDLPLGPEPVQVAPLLWGQQSDVYFNIRKYWGTIQAYVASVFRWRGLDEVMAEEMTVIPGMDELASLLWIAEHHDQGTYDVIVVDAAPTGETLRLLSLPEAGKWWLEKILPLERSIARIAGPVLSRTIGMPAPRDEVFAAGEDLFRKLEHMRALLSDPTLSSIRIVLNLEKMVIKESQRAFTYFHLYGYLDDLVVSNRVLPDSVGGYFQSWRETQARYKPMVDEMFAPVPVREVPFLDQEVVGIDMLRRVGEQLFHGDDPTAFYYRGRPYEVLRENGEHVISMQLPFMTKEEVKLSRHADELVLEVGTFRRNLILPRLLADAPTKGAKLDGTTLKIRFASRSRAVSAPRGAGGD
ncbi:MAG TPA: TRC40/GET3/ArsA family transport-energizing ATPase [Gaiellaceae bacterium]|nr:TRC40/GET3/ArsA family transport-energizing ATPase [Gaiellaceae bacterium]